MKRLIVPVFVGCLLMLACKTTNVPPPLVPVIRAGEPIAADCGAPAVRDLATHLLDDVASALMATGDWRQALSAVAARAGSDGSAAVKCALGELLAQSSNQLAMRARMEKDAIDRTQLAHDRALTWLGEHPDPGPPGATNERTNDMGTWNIKIKGQGIHHNHLANDANVLSAGFVKQLKEAGHIITGASFDLTSQIDGQEVVAQADDIGAPEYAASAGPPSAPATPEG